MGLKSASPEDDVQGDGGLRGMLGSSVTSEEPVKGRGRPWIRLLDIKPRRETVKMRDHSYNATKVKFKSVQIMKWTQH